MGYGPLAGALYSFPWKRWGAAALTAMAIRRWRSGRTNSAARNVVFRAARHISRRHTRGVRNRRRTFRSRGRPSRFSMRTSRRKHGFIRGVGLDRSMETLKLVGPTKGLANSVAGDNAFTANIRLKLSDLINEAVVGGRRYIDLVGKYSLMKLSGIRVTINANTPCDHRWSTRVVAAPWTDVVPADDVAQPTSPSDAHNFEEGLTRRRYCKRVNAGHYDPAGKNTFSLWIPGSVLSAPSDTFFNTVYRRRMPWTSTDTTALSEVLAAEQSFSIMVGNVSALHYWINPDSSGPALADYQTTAYVKFRGITQPGEPWKTAPA